MFLHSRVAVRLRLEDGARITAQELQAMVIEEEDVSLPKQAMEVFAIWMVSPVLGQYEGKGKKEYHLPKSTPISSMP